MQSMQPYAIIMCGGRGKRFWPLSQVSLPKQFLHFAGEGTLFQQTFRRVRQIMAADHIYAVTRESYKTLILEQVQEFVPENVIIEPEQHNTGPCVALGTAYIQQRAPNATIAVLPADHYIADEDVFGMALQAGLDYAFAAGELVTFGIHPEFPHTGFGYIQASELIGDLKGIQVYRGRRFIEKPDLETARRFLEQHDFYWNSGIFCWRSDIISDAFRQMLPEVFESINSFQECIGTAFEQEALKNAYMRMPTVSIDHGVMERVHHLAVIPMNVGWNDVGSWTALRRLYATPADDNLVLGEHLVDRVSGSTIIGKGRIIIIGVSDVIVAQNGNDVLVCAKDLEHKIQTIVDRLEHEA